MKRLRRGAQWIAPLILASLIALVPWSDAAVTGKVAININVQDIRSVGVEQATMSILREMPWTITAGVGINQADQCAQAVRTLTTAATEDLDFTGATPTFSNSFGTALFQKIKFIAVQAAPGNTTSVTISRPAGATGLPLFAAISDSLAPLKPGGFFAFADPSVAGIAATDGTGDKVTMTNSAGATATYTVVVCGIKS